MTNNLIGNERYLLETNAFINAKDNYYNPEIIPAFWQWILAGHQQGCFYSIDKVCAELKKVKRKTIYANLQLHTLKFFYLQTLMTVLMNMRNYRFGQIQFGRWVKALTKLTKLMKSLHLKQKLTRFWLFMKS